MEVPAEPQLFLLDKLFTLSGWDSSHLTLVTKSNCLATRGFSVMNVLKGNVHQKRTRGGRRKLFCQATLLEIEAIAELKISGSSGVLFIYFNIFFWAKTEGLQSWAFHCAWEINTSPWGKSFQAVLSFSHLKYILKDNSWNGLSIPCIALEAQREELHLEVSVSQEETALAVRKEFSQPSFWEMSLLLFLPSPAGEIG